MANLVLGGVASNSILTLVAIIAFPAGYANALPSLGAFPVAKVVTPRIAVPLAALAVVIGGAGHTVLVAHPRVLTAVLVVVPHWPYV